MNKRIAIIKDGVVVNVAVWDGVTPWSPGPEFDFMDLAGFPDASIGWHYANGEFWAPEPQEPSGE